MDKEREDDLIEGFAQLGALSINAQHLMIQEMARLEDWCRLIATIILMPPEGDLKKGYLEILDGYIDNHTAGVTQANQVLVINRDMAEDFTSKMKKVLRGSYSIRAKEI